MGFGAGVLYPVVASLEQERSSVSVARAAVGVPLGLALVYFVAWFLATVAGDSVEWQWRVQLGSGAVFAAAVAYLAQPLFARGSSSCSANVAEALLADVDEDTKPCKSTLEISSETRARAIADRLCEFPGLEASLRVHACLCWVQNCGFYGFGAVYAFIVSDALGTSSLTLIFAWSLLGVGPAIAPALLAAQLVKDSPSTAIACYRSWIVASLGGLLGTLLYACLGDDYGVGRVLSVVLIRWAITVPIPPIYAFATTITPPDLRTLAHGSTASFGKSGAFIGSVAAYPLYVAAGPTVALAVCTALSVLALGLCLKLCDIQAACAHRHTPRPPGTLVI